MAAAVEDPELLVRVMGLEGEGAGERALDLFPGFLRVLIDELLGEAAGARGDGDHEVARPDPPGGIFHPQLESELARQERELRLVTMDVPDHPECALGFQVARVAEEDAVEEPVDFRPRGVVGGLPVQGRGERLRPSLERPAAAEVGAARDVRGQKVDAAEKRRRGGAAFVERADEIGALEEGDVLVEEILAAADPVVAEDRLHFPLELIEGEKRRVASGGGFLSAILRQ